VIWDGHTSSVARTTVAAVTSGMSIPDQIAAIHAAKPKEDNKPTIGPLQGGINQTIQSQAPKQIQTPIIRPIGSTTATNMIPRIGVHPFRGPSPIISSTSSTIAAPPIYSHPNMTLFNTPPLKMMGNIPLTSAVSAAADIDMMESASKKPRTEIDSLLANLIPEEAFLQNNPDSFVLQVQVPQVDSGSSSKVNWNLNGQILSFEVSLSDTIAQVKDLIKDQLSMPANKQNLKCLGLPFLKDQQSLAFYNLKSDIIVQLSVKERGGRGNK